MGLGTTPRPHHITWDYRAGYRASRRYVADTTHFLLSVSHQARKRARITHSGPSEPCRGRAYGRMARPIVNAMPNASCSRPVWPSALISAGPEAPARTDRIGSRASGSASAVSSVNGR
jgi:hypothetical protein